MFKYWNYKNFNVYSWLAFAWLAFYIYDGNVLNLGWACLLWMIYVITYDIKTKEDLT